MRRELPQHFVPYGVIERARFGFGLQSAMLPTCGPFAASSTFMTTARIGLSCRGLLCHGGLRGSAEKRIGRRAVPAERPREPRQRHDQQQQGRIESQRHMTVVPEPAAAIGARHFQPVAQCLAAAGNPKDQAADKNQHQSQRRYPDDGFSDRLFAFRRRRVEQPAMKFPHRAEECRAFGPAVHTSRVGVYAQLFASRLAESGHAGFVAAGGELQRNQVQRIPPMRSASCDGRSGRASAGAATR